MQQEQLDQKAAAAKVRAYDREMSGRIDYLFGLDWTRPENYDLVINTRDDAWGFYTDLLAAAARHPQYQPTPESRQKIRDLSLAAQVRAALATDPGTQHINVEVTASHETFVTAEVARRVPGVTNVSCEAVEIPRVYPGPIM